MKAATVTEIRQELKQRTPAQLVELCQRLARFKKENKELLTYLLFEADDLVTYLKNVKEEMDENFSGVNTRNIYQAKKTIRKILRTTNKYIRYTGSKTAEVELLIHYIQCFRQMEIPYHRSAALVNLYKNQLKKIKSAIAGLHEDLQYDYQRQVEKLEL